jgi:hypothetical protein
VPTVLEDCFFVRADGSNRLKVNTFFKHIRKINNALAFASVNVNIVRFNAGPPVYKIQGAMYHRSSALRPTQVTVAAAVPAIPAHPSVQVAPAVAAVNPLAPLPSVINAPIIPAVTSFINVVPNLRNAPRAPPVAAPRNQLGGPVVTAARARPALPAGTASYAQTYVIDAGQALIDREIVFNNGQEKPLGRAEMDRIREILSSVGDWLKANNPFARIYQDMDTKLRNERAIAIRDNLPVPDIRMYVKQKLKIVLQKKI